MVLDKAGWHGAGALRLVGNVTLVPLPQYLPQLNPMERVWLYLRERHLSLRVFPDQNAIVDACCNARNAIAADTERLRSLCLQPWIERVIRKARRYYIAALTASRRISNLAARRDRMPAKAKAPKTILIANARQLFVILNAMLRNGTPLAA